MSIVVNLLPEARLIKLRDRRRKTLTTGALIFIGVVVGTIIATLLFLIAANAAIESTSKSHISDVEKDIGTLKTVEQTVATLQEHLQSFYDLNSSRLFASSVFGNLSNTIQPGTKLTDFAIDDKSVATVKGVADDYKALSTLVKAIEDYNVNYKVNRPDDLKFNLEPGKALFENVQITQSPQDLKTNKVNFTVTFNVNKDLIKSSSPGTPQPSMSPSPGVTP